MAAAAAIEAGIGSAVAISSAMSTTGPCCTTVFYRQPTAPAGVELSNRPDRGSRLNAMLRHVRGCLPVIINDPVRRRLYSVHRLPNVGPRRPAKRQELSREQKMPKTNGRAKKLQERSLRRPQLDVAAFRGQWVAVDPRTYKIVGNGASMEEARQGAPNLARQEPILFFVPRSDGFFVGHSP